jgi:hypothetical protein
LLNCGSNKNDGLLEKENDKNTAEENPSNDLDRCVERVENAIKTRISNNIVESSFKTDKHPLKIYKRSPHEISSKFINRVKTIALRYDLGSEILVNAKNIEMEEDYWKDSKRGAKSYLPYDKKNIGKLDELRKKKDAEKLAKQKTKDEKQAKAAEKRKKRPESKIFDDQELQKLPKEIKSAIPSLQIQVLNQHLPFNGGVFKVRSKPAITITKTCTIDYFLYGLWLTVRVNENLEGALVEKASKNDTYNCIHKIVNLIESSNWSKAKYTWLEHIERSINLNF